MLEIFVPKRKRTQVVNKPDNRNDDWCNGGRLMMKDTVECKKKKTFSNKNWNLRVVRRNFLRMWICLAPNCNDKSCISIFCIKCSSVWGISAFSNNFNNVTNGCIHGRFMNEGRVLNSHKKKTWLKASSYFPFKNIFASKFSWGVHAWTPLSYLIQFLQENSRKLGIAVLVVSKEFSHLFSLRGKTVLSRFMKEV